MTGFELFTTVLGIIRTVCAIVFGYIAFHRNSKNDDEAEGKKDGVLLTEIGYIKSGVNDIDLRLIPKHTACDLEVFGPQGRT